MKIRRGFVSNSSSSSFVIALPKDLVVTPESIRAFFFPNVQELTTIGYGLTIDSWVTAIPAQTAAEVICDHISAANDARTLERDVVEGYLVPSGNRQGIMLARDGILAKIDRTKESFYIVRLSSDSDDNNEQLLCTLAQNGLFGPAEKIRVR
jgi:hypothetical protein